MATVDLARNSKNAKGIEFHATLMKIFVDGADAPWEHSVFPTFLIAVVNVDSFIVYFTVHCLCLPIFV